MLVLSSGTSTWDSGVAGPGWTLSNYNRTATCNHGSFTTILSRGRSYARGSANKVYFEIAVSDWNARLTGRAGGILCGISNRSGPLANYLGSDSNSSSYQPQDNYPASSAWFWLSNNNTAVTSIRNVLNGVNHYTIGIAVDFGAEFIWGTATGSTWNQTGTDNPATGVGGLSLAALLPGSYYMALTGNNKTSSFTASGRLVARAPFSFIGPSGFVAWG